MSRGRNCQRDTTVPVAPAHKSKIGIKCPRWALEREDFPVTIDMAAGEVVQSCCTRGKMRHREIYGNQLLKIAWQLEGLLRKGGNQPRANPCSPEKGRGRSPVGCG